MAKPTVGAHGWLAWGSSVLRTTFWKKKEELPGLVPFQVNRPWLRAGVPGGPCWCAGFTFFPLETLIRKMLERKHSPRSEGKRERSWRAHVYVCVHAHACGGTVSGHEQQQKHMKLCSPLENLLLTPSHRHQRKRCFTRNLSEGDQPLSSKLLLFVKSNVWFKNKYSTAWLRKAKLPLNHEFYGIPRFLKRAEATTWGSTSWPPTDAPLPPGQAPVFSSPSVPYTALGYLGSPWAPSQSQMSKIKYIRL